MLPSEKLKKAIDESGIPYEKLGELTGIPKSSIQRYATGKTKKIPIDALEKLAPHLNVTATYIAGWGTVHLEVTNQNTFDLVNVEIIPIEKQKIPILGTIAAGVPIYADEEFECYVECGAHIKADYALRVKGDSMINARILDGDIVFIRKQDTVNQGEIAAVLIDNDATLKRFYQYGNHIVLKAENPNVKDIEFELGDDVNIRILGKAVAFQSDVR